MSHGSTGREGGGGGLTGGEDGGRLPRPCRSCATATPPLSDPKELAEFGVGVDVLEFTGTGINSLADLSFSKVGNDTVISYGYHGSSITLVGVGLEQLMSHSAHDFLFV